MWGLFPVAVDYPGTSCFMVHRPHPLVMHWPMSTERRDDALYGGTTLAVTHSFPPLYGMATLEGSGWAVDPGYNFMRWMVG